MALLGFVAQLLNSVIVLLIVNANIKGVGYASTALEFSILNGSYNDFTQVRVLGGWAGVGQEGLLA
jgi:hypothetical protein